MICSRLVCRVTYSLPRRDFQNAANDRVGGTATWSASARGSHLGEEPEHSVVTFVACGLESVGDDVETLVLDAEVLESILSEADPEKKGKEIEIKLVARLWNEAGIHCRPSLLPGIDIDDWVRFSRLPFSNATIVFGREEALKTLLAPCGCNRVLRAA